MGQDDVEVAVPVPFALVLLVVEAIVAGVDACTAPDPGGGDVGVEVGGLVPRARAVKPDWAPSAGHNIGLQPTNQQPHWAPSRACRRHTARVG